MLLKEVPPCPSNTASLCMIDARPAVCSPMNWPFCADNLKCSCWPCHAGACPLPTRSQRPYTCHLMSSSCEKSACRVTLNTRRVPSPRVTSRSWTSTPATRKWANSCKKSSAGKAASWHDASASIVATVPRSTCAGASWCWSMTDWPQARRWRWLLGRCGASSLGCWWLWRRSPRPQRPSV